MKTNWNGKRVLILGAARQGLALARWLSIHGAHVTLSDSRSVDDLHIARESLAEFQITWALGGHPLELLDSTDVLCLSGGVPLTLPIVAEAIQRGIPLSNDSQIFMEVVPCRTIGITGSAGKTTTTTLVGQMAKLACQNAKAQKAEGRPQKDGSAFRGLPSSYVGGNIGDPLLNYVDEMKPEDIAILELSSFQLDQMTISPNIAAILNITPNHLDRHGTMEAYTAAKARILAFQSKDDVAILGRDDKGAWRLRTTVKGKLFTFSLNELDEGLSGAYHEDGLLSLRDGNAYMPLLLREKIMLRGDHNILNVLAAFTIGHAAGFPLDVMLEAAEESFDELMQTNVKGPHFLTQTAANWMAGQGSGHIVFVSSISAYTASVNRGEYCISKAGVSMMTALFADRLAEYGILVYEVRPGVINTDMTSVVKDRYDALIGGGLTPVKRWGEPDDVARAVLAIVQGYLPFSTGEVINVDGGFHLRRL